MKRLFAATLVVFMLVLPLSACAEKPTGGSEKLTIVATTFPQYDWARQILGERENDVELVLLLGDGVDLHSYQPTVADIAKISTCDVFIHVGGASDAWVHDVLGTAVNKDMLVINMVEALGDRAREEEIIEGMEHDHDEHSHDDHDHDDEHHHKEHALDEHVWLSLINAQLLCESIAAALETADAEHAALYRANAESYIAKLAAIDGEYRAAVDSAARRTLLFCDRFPFRYLVDDYGIEYYAAFAGCSAETEASFETIVFLANKLDELQLQSVMTIDGGNTALARTVIESTNAKNQQILTLDSMQSVTAAGAASGVTYLSVMEANLTVLKAALA